MSLTEFIRGRTVCVALAPDQLTALVRRGRKIEAGSERRIALDPELGWAGAVAALRAYLEEAPPGLPVSAGLSLHWCQLALLPWSDALLDDAPRHLAAQFSGIYGDAARAWAITCDDAPYGQPRLACAVEQGLLDAINGAAHATGRRCVAIESLLSIAWRAIAGERPAAFALVEAGRLALASVARGRIVALQTQPLRGAWQTELPQAWQRWTLRAPELGAIGQVALVSLDPAARAGDAPAGFHAARLPLAPAYAAACLVGA